MGLGIKSLAKDTVIYGTTNIVSKFLNWLLAPFYIRILATSAEYGIVTNLYAWVSVVLVVLTLGLETGLFRFMSTSDNSNRVYATILKILASAVALFLLLGLSNVGGIAGALGYPDFPEFVGIFIVIVALDALMSVPFAYLRYKKRPLRFASYKFLFIFLNIGFNLFFLLLCPYLIRKGVALPHWLYRPDYGVGYIFISNLLASSIEFLLMLPVIRPGLKGFDKSLLLPLAHYCMPLVLLGLAGNFNKMAGQILLPLLYEDRLEGMTQLGIFGGNLKIAVVMVMFIQAFRFAYDPFVFSKMREEDAPTAYRVAMNYFLLFALIIFLGVMYWIDLFKHVVRPEYYVGLGVVPVAMASEILFGVYYNLSFWYKVSDRTYFGAVFSVIGLIVTVAIIVLGVPHWGFMACAWASFVCNALMLVMSYLLGKKYHPIKYDWGRMVGMTLLAVLFYYGGMSIVPSSVAARLIIRTLLLIIYIGLAIRFFAPEARQLLNTFKSRR
ncbi:MAG: hypothetical protein Q4D93_03355 [Porphyromonas sp.]|nr:hypothetical protein [Porphyromonas sp.]